MMDLDTLTDVLGKNLDGAVRQHGDDSLRVFATCIAPRRREFQIRNPDRVCIVSVSLIDADGGLHLRMKAGANWLHTVSMGTKDPLVLFSQVAGVVFAMLHHQARIAA